MEINDYTKLIRSLRVESFEVGSAGLAKNMNEAADAIEALQAEAQDAAIEYAIVCKKLGELKQQMPKRGEWISDRLVTTNGGTYGVRRCSICEAYYQDIGYGWNYCPNCGAKIGETHEGT